MKLGLHLVDFTWRGGPSCLASVLVEIAEAAERNGFDAIAINDHLWSSRWMGGIEREMLESYSTLAFLAGHTSRAKLMTVVAAAPYRAPALLAKTVTTLDVLSGGRAWLGIGVGDNPEEAAGLGLPYPSLSERFDMLDETLQVCLRMWSGERGDEQPFHGKHVHLERALNVPQSLSRPHPPIMIAGDGERRTLPLVARYADACSLKPTPEIPHKLDLLRRLCESEGRDYDTIAKTSVWAFDVGDDGSGVSDLLEKLRWFAALGIVMVVGRVAGVDRIRPLEVLGREVIPAVAELQRGGGPIAGGHTA